MADLKKFRIVKSQPASVAKRAHYYSFTNKQGERDTRIEDHLAEVESAAQPLLLRLSRMEPILAVDERFHLSYYLATMRFRVPAARDNVEAFYHQIYEHTMELMMREPGILEATAKRMGKTKEEIEAEDFDGHREFYQEHRDWFQIEVDPVFSLRLLAEQSYNIAQIIARMQMTLLINNTEQRFITSDNPVALRNPELEQGFFNSPGFGQKHVEITFPVTPWVALLFAHTPGPIISEVTPLQIWEINSRTQGTCDRFVFTADWWDAMMSLQGIIQYEDLQRTPPWGAPA